MIFNIFCALQRFFDKAAVAEAGGGNSAETASPWRLCTVTQVEEVKGLLRCLPIALSTMLLYMVLAQVQTWTIQQGYTMERRIGAHYLIPPATLSAIAIAVVLLEVGAYDFFLVPVLRRMTGSIHGLSHLQRIGMGLALSIVGLAYAALLESIRLAMAKSHHLVSQSGSNAAIVPLSIFWQMPILVIMGTAIFFAHAGLFEFFYYESPVRMRSLGTALSMLPIKKVGGKGWLESQDLNHNHLNYFFLLMAVMSLINFVVYLITARYYEYKEFINIASVCTKKSRHPSPRGDNPPLEAQSSQSASSVTLHL
jgi:peptide/histidine transporter 3/4